MCDRRAGALTLIKSQFHPSHHQRASWKEHIHSVVERNPYFFLYFWPFDTRDHGSLVCALGHSSSASVYSQSSLYMDGSLFTFPGICASALAFLYLFSTAGAWPAVPVLLQRQSTNHEVWKLTFPTQNTIPPNYESMKPRSLPLSFPLLNGRQEKKNSDKKMGKLSLLCLSLLPAWLTKALLSWSWHPLASNWHLFFCSSRQVNRRAAALKQLKTSSRSCPCIRAVPLKVW